MKVQKSKSEKRLKKFRRILLKLRASDGYLIIE